MSRASPHLLVIGAGSVGKRHLRNLAALGARVSAMDPRADRLEEAAREVSLQNGFSKLEDALSGGPFEGAVVCSPPSMHVDQAIECLHAGLPLMIEKPLATTAAEARRLMPQVKRANVPVLLGYTYRWWPPLSDFIAAIRAGQIGQPRHVRCVMSAHLADWHPWEPYNEFFMARAALGGGAVLDESHFLDLMLWYFGMPKSVYARIERLSGLQIDTDDNVDALLEYADGLRITIHLDLFGRPHEKSIRVVGDDGTIEWTFEPNEVRVGRVAEAKWEARRYDFERNDMFVATAREYLDLLAGRRRDPTCSVEDGVRVLDVIDAMRASSMSGRRVELERNS